LVEECAAEWELDLEEPFAGAFVSHVVPAGDVVLKIQWPHRESEHEADALELGTATAPSDWWPETTSATRSYSSVAAPEPPPRAGA
jgi:hypothetical protein